MKMTRRPRRRPYLQDVTGTASTAAGEPSRLSTTLRDPRKEPADKGFIIASLQRAVVTDDGRDILLTVERPGGRIGTIACPTDLIANLISMLTQCLATAQRRQGPTSSRQVLLAQGFKLQPVGDRLLAVIAISGGAEMSFMLPVEVGRKLRSILAPQQSSSAPTPGSARG